MTNLYIYLLWSYLILLLGLFFVFCFFVYYRYQDWIWDNFPKYWTKICVLPSLTLSQKIRILQPKIMCMCVQKAKG